MSQLESAPQKKCGERVKDWWTHVRDWLEYKDKEEWLKDMRGNLSLVASIIATMTFQSAISPPGGVFQANPGDKLTATINDSTDKSLTLRRGEAVLAAVQPGMYAGFLVSNTICFIASLCVCLLLVSGFPLDHRFPIWISSIGMCISIISLALTYLFAAAMVTPSNIWGGTLVLSAFGIVILVWTALMGVVGLVFVIRLCVWSLRTWNDFKRSRNKERI